MVDGGLPHYDRGGLLGVGENGTGQPVSVAGTLVGVADGRTVAWDDVTVRANGEPVVGLALCCSRDIAGVKLVGEGIDLSVGESVTVTVDREDSSP